MTGSGGDADPVDVMAVVAEGRRLLRRARLVTAGAALAAGGIVAGLGFGARALLQPADATDGGVEVTGDSDPSGTTDDPTVTTTSTSTTTSSTSSTTTTESTTTTTAPELVSIPELEGREQVDAESALARAGLSVGDIIEEYSNEVLLGAVLRTEPPGGTDVPIGSPVTLAVSLGPEFVAIPDVEGFTEEEATAWLEDDRLAVGSVIEECSGRYDPGIALRTEPPAGTRVSQGTQVTLVVSGIPPTGCVD